MRKLSNLEDDIVKVLAIRYACDYDTIKSIYLRLESVDQTISHLDVWYKI